jgi:hypothetical protein
LSNKKTEKTWLQSQAESEAKKDVMPMSERWGSIAPVAGIAIVLLFFTLHQTWSTGFFTSGFRSLEALFFYGPMVLFLLTIIGRIVIGRKNAVRPFDALTLAVVGITVIWLYIVFPFDFAHLADVLPNSLRFILQWISNDIAKIVMILMILGSFFFAGYTALLHVVVKQELSKSQSST